MEQLQAVNGAQFIQMVQAGAENLRTYAEEVNNLNVFPIPDGDTGDNMLLTILGGTEAADSGKGVGDAARGIADHMLLSARGNSGVILSQFFEGIAEELHGLEAADSLQMAEAFRQGVRCAYNAVIEPAEGTMLTVMRLASEAVTGRDFLSPEGLLQFFIQEARNVLEKTPQLLPVLKKAGVVDSGGAGFVYIMEGMLRGLTDGVRAIPALPAPVRGESDLNLFTEDSVLEYGYCTELLLRLQWCKTNLNTFDLAALIECLRDIGDSVAAFRTGSIVKIHIHTMTPDRVLSLCRQYGEFLRVKIENMSLQHNNAVLDGIPLPPVEEERKEYGIVAAASGKGIKEMFLYRGADAVVDGGQGMNPTAGDFLEAFDRVNADTIFVLPNNDNVIAAAKQAAGMYGKSAVYVIESRSIGDGYAALSMYDTTAGDAGKIVEQLTDAMEGVVTACVSRSLRDTAETRAGNYVGFVGKDILASGTDRVSVACQTVSRLNPGRFDICILLRSAGTTEQEAEKIREYIGRNYKDKEVYIINGMQDIYDYIMILE